MSKLNVGIVFGGGGVESDVSILSALQLKKSINIKKYNVILIYISKDNRFYIDKNLDKLDTYKNKKNNFTYEVFFRKNSKGKVYLINKGMKRKEIDVIIPAVHGAGYEDGVVSSLYEFLNLPVVMTSSTSLGLMQNKKYTKDILLINDIDVCKGILIKEYDYYHNRDQVINKINELDYPLIVKPNTLGSSVGINFVNSPNELKEALVSSFNYETNLLIEEALTDFREFNCAIVGYKNYQTSAIEEVVSNGEFYSYENKYIFDTTKILNPSLDETLEKEIKDLSLKIAEIFNLIGLIRIDYLFDNKEKKLYVNEINGIPGSFSYYLFEKEGLLFTEIIDRLIDISIRVRFEKSQKKHEIKSKIFEKEIKEK